MEPCSKKLKMVCSPSMSINDLPYEIMEIIFSNLDYHSRQNVTEVCKTWSEIAFLPDHTQLHIWSRKGDLKSLNVLLEKSKRKYVNINATNITTNESSQALEKALKMYGQTLKSLEITYCKSNNFIGLLNCFRMTENLESLQLNSNIIYESPADKNELPVLVHLKKLHFNFNSYNLNSRRFIEDTMELAPNVQELTFDRCDKMVPHAEFAFLTLIRFYSPNLKKLKHYIWSEEVYREFCKIDFPNIENLTFSSPEYKKRIGGLNILVQCLKKGKLKRLKLDLDSYDVKEIDKINLNDWPSLEKLWINLKLFGSLKDGQTLDSLKILELQGDTTNHDCSFYEQDVLEHVFKNVKFIALESLHLISCLFSVSTLELIDKSSPNLKKLVIEGGEPDDEEEDIEEFLDDKANFKNMKFFSWNDDLVRRY